MRIIIAYPWGPVYPRGNVYIRLKVQFVKMIYVYGDKVYLGMPMK